MSRNVTILVVVLVILLIAGYLIWLRNKFQTVSAPAEVVPTVTVVPTVEPTPASPSATPASSPSVTRRVSPSVTPRASTVSGQTVRQ